MTINFLPWYSIANEGCYFWGWVVACEMQVTIFVPFIVTLMSKLNWKGKSFALTFLLFVGMAALFCIVWKHNLAEAIFNSADLYAVMFFLNKPYTKIHAVSIGMAMAFIF
jgi:peptidoglycan/LPS O-acetylase OafA/YrhL